MTEIILAWLSSDQFWVGMFVGIGTSSITHWAINAFIDSIVDRRHRRALEKEWLEFMRRDNSQASKTEQAIEAWHRLGMPTVEEEKTEGDNE